MAGSFNRRKTVKKSEYWSKHGKCKDRVGRCAELNRSRRERERIKKARAEKMYPTIQEAMAAAREEMLRHRPRASVIEGRDPETCTVDYKTFYLCP